MVCETWIVSVGISFKFCSESLFGIWWEIVCDAPQKLKEKLETQRWEEEVTTVYLFLNKRSSCGNKPQSERRTPLNCVHFNYHWSQQGAAQMVWGRCLAHAPGSWQIRTWNLPDQDVLASLTIRPPLPPFFKIFFWYNNAIHLYKYYYVIIYMYIYYIRRHNLRPDGGVNDQSSSQGRFHSWL